MPKHKILIISASDRIVGGHSIQARDIVEHFSNHSRVELNRYDIDRPLPSFVSRISYIRTIINEICYICGLLPRILWSEVLHIFSASYWSFLLAPAPAILLGRLFGRKIILNYHSGEANDHLHRWGIIAKPLLRLADEIVVPSEYLRSVFARHGLKSWVISNSIDVRRFEDLRWNKQMSLNIICTRNFEAHYRVDKVIEAFGIIKSEIEDARLTLIGDGSHRKQLEKLVDKLNIKDVSFLGQVDNKKISEYYHQADLYLNASIVDNMPISLMEAMASGLVIVSSESGGIPYFVENGFNGLLVTSNKPEELAKEVIEIFRDPIRFERLRSNAVEYSRRFSNECVCKEWERVYSYLLENAG